MKLLSSKTREPTWEEIAREQAVGLSCVADFLILILQISFAIVTGSLTLLSEFTRSSFMLSIEVYSLWLLRGVHRGRMKHFQFGVGKIEQFSWLIIGLGMAVSGIWIAERVILSFVEANIPPTPLGLAFAAIVNAANLTVNWVSLFAMIAGPRESESDIFGAQIKARIVKCVNSTFLQVTLTIAALSSDPVIGLVMDGIGAGFVSGVMIVNGLAMVGRSLPDLLDAPLSADEQSLISDTIRSLHAPSVHILNIRSRRSGRFPQVEVIVAPVHPETAGQMHDEIERLRQAVHDLDRHIDVTFVIAGRDATQPAIP